MEKVKNTKKKGFVLIMVIILIVLISSAIFSVTMLNISNSNDVVKDIQKNKAYYIANAGLEMFYSALSKEAVTTIDTRGTPDKEIKGPTIIQQTGAKNSGLEIIGNSGTKDIIRKSDNYVIPIEGIGTATIEVQLQKVDDKYIYRVYSTGKLLNADNNVKDTHILTMFIKKDDAENPTIYDGIKENME